MKAAVLGSSSCSSACLPPYQITIFLCSCLESLHTGSGTKKIIDHPFSEKVSKELFKKKSVIKAGNKLKEVEVVQGGSVVLYDFG